MVGMRCFAISVSLMLLSCSAVMSGGEKAAYDTIGRLTALLSDGEDVEIASNVVAVLPNGKRIPLMTRREGREASRSGEALAWSLGFELPDGGKGQLAMKSEEDPAGLRYSVALTADSNLDVEAIELVLDLPHALLLHGTVTPAGGPAIPLPVTKPASPFLFRGETAWLQFSGASSDVKIDVLYDGSPTATVVDRWDAAGRAYQVRAALARGPVASGTKAGLATTIRLSGAAITAPAAHLSLDTAKVRYSFDGFGGNYCWDTRSPVAAYTLQSLKLKWARTEMKLLAWDKHRDAPTAEIRGDMETMQRFQKLGIPYVISIWWLPERFYTDAYEKPKSAHFRLIRQEKWDELLDLIGSYLVYAKREYGAEPDLFSFNEANIGIYVGLTPEAHTEAIKHIGAHFQKLGLKTRMILGDATGPRDTYKFVLDGAADPEALKYVGAIAFHSWGGGTAEQYTAWGDVAEWLGLPLLVTELGVDAAAYHNRAYSSYHYGLQEAKMTQELLKYARPQGTQFWQFTNDYALARVGEGGAVVPTARFWLVKHFTDLTPPHAEALGVASDQSGVLATAFRKDGSYVVHLLNVGAARPATLAGVPPGLQWRRIESTEAAQYQDRGIAAEVSGALQLDLPAHSLVSLIGK